MMILYKYLVNWAQSVQTDISPPVRMLFDHRLTQALLISISSILLPALAQDDLSSLAEAIPGVPGEDFPIFGELPSTSFLCEGRQQGYYADPEVRLPTICELWAVRNLSRLTVRCSISVWTRTSSLLLSRTTLSCVQMGPFSGGVNKVENICFSLRIRFRKLKKNSTLTTSLSQQYFVCDWWFNVDCSLAESFYNLNELIFE